MNQILYCSDYSNKKKHNKKYIVFLFFCIFLIIILLFYSYIYFSNLHKNNKLSKDLAKSFNIATLYNNSDKYITSDVTNQNNSDLFIIGIIEINKIGLRYPIISYSSEDFLKMAPCRFAGPNPNEIGNLCIAGHNYIDNSFFGKLNLLNIDDEIKISNLSGVKLTYKIYEKKEINNNDFSCTSQETNGVRIVTLMTCNSIKDTRIILVGKEFK